MALSVGSLVAMLKLDASQFAKGATSAVKEVEKIAKSFDQIGKKAERLGVMISAPIVLALHEAAKSSQPVKDALTRVSTAFSVLSEQVARAVLPVVNQFADALQGVARWLQEMDPHTKATIVAWVEMAAKAALFLALFGKLAGVVEIVAKLALLLTGPLLTAVAVIGVLITAAALLREAWAENLGGIREKFAAVWKWITDVLGGFAAFLGRVLKDALETWVSTLRVMAIAWDSFQKMIGNKTSPIAGFLADLADKVEGGGVADVMHDVWVAFQEGADASLKFAGKGLEKLKKDVKDALGLAGFKLPSFGGGADLSPSHSVAIRDVNSRHSLDAHKALSGVDGMSAAAIAEMKAAFAREDVIKEAMAQPLEVMGSAFAEDAKARHATVLAMVEETEGLEAAAKQARAFADNAANAANSLIQKFMSRMGRVADLAQSAMQGLAAGGPWGAVIAVLIDLATSAGQFMKTVDILNDAFKVVADVIGRMFASGEKHQQAFGNVLIKLAEAFGPIFDFISEIVDTITPVLTVIGELFKAVGYIVAAFKPLFSIIITLTNLFNKGLIIAIKAISLILLGLAWVIGKVINVLVDVIAGIVGVFDGDAADKMRKAKINTDDIEKSMSDIVNGVDADTQAHVENAAAVQKATEAMLNVPQGFKVSLARYQSILAGYGAGGGASAAGTGSTSGVLAGPASGGHTTAGNSQQAQQNINHRGGHGIPHYALGGIVSSPTVALIGEAGPEAVVPLNGKGGGLGGVTINATIVTSDPNDLWRKLKTLAERDRWRGNH